MEAKEEGGDPFVGFTPSQIARARFVPHLPSVLTRAFELRDCEALGAVAEGADKIHELFPKTYGRPRLEFAPSAAPLPERALKIGCVLSGGQAPGGHNVISGLFDAVRKNGGELYGFLDGPAGVFKHKYVRITPTMMDRYRNMGGFDMIGSGRDKIETAEQYASQAVCDRLGLNGLIIIGGDDSNTNAALLAEYFAKQGCPTSVIGCPKTIDGDLKNKYIPISFGFDTACKIFAEQIGSIETDTLGSQKYWHFIRLMGRTSSHITLECALQTQPNVTLLGEVVETRRQSLASIAEELVDVIVARSRKGKDYGVVLVPEGLIEFVPEIGALIHELNDVLAERLEPITPEQVEALLSPANVAVLHALPPAIRRQLLLDRDAHGNVQVSKIETEQLLMLAVAARLEALRSAGRYAGRFQTVAHFLGYEGRCGMPSNFDCMYCYALGTVAAALVLAGKSGYMATVSNLQSAFHDWACGGIPLTMMMAMERRAGKWKPVIKKAYMDMAGLPFHTLTMGRRLWAMEDRYRAPGPIQFAGAGADALTMTLSLELRQAAEGISLDAAGGVEFSAMLSDVMKTGVVSPAAADMLLNYRLRHGIADVPWSEEHGHTQPNLGDELAKLGYTLAQWATALARGAE